MIRKRKFEIGDGVYIKWSPTFHSKGEVVFKCKWQNDFLYLVKTDKGRGPRIFWLKAFDLRYIRHSVKE